MLNCTYPKTTQISFAHKPKDIAILPKVRDAVADTLTRVESPLKLYEERELPDVVVQRLEYRLRALRSMLESSKTPMEYFRTLVDGVRSFRVANCAEMAEIAKLALKVNGVTDCDIFCLYAKKAGSSKPPVNLDQTLVALNIPKAQNNKATLIPFAPSPDTKILDVWIGNFVGTIQEVRPKYRSMGLMPEDEVMFRPIRTFEPDENVFAAVKEDFPSLIVKE